MKISFGNSCPCCKNPNRHREHRTWLMRVLGVKKLFICTKCRSHYIILFGKLALGLSRCPRGAKYWNFIDKE